MPDRDEILLLAQDREGGAQALPRLLDIGATISLTSRETLCRTSIAG